LCEHRKLLNLSEPVKKDTTMYVDRQAGTLTTKAIKLKLGTGYRWLMPIILATQVAEIRRVAVRIQPRKIVHETLS
jgi:hypothetical protein